MSNQPGGGGSNSTTMGTFKRLTNEQRCLLIVVGAALVFAACSLVRVDPIEGGVMVRVVRSPSSSSPRPSDVVRQPEADNGGGSGVDGVDDAKNLNTDKKDDVKDLNVEDKKDDIENLHVDKKKDDVENLHLDKKKDDTVNNNCLYHLTAFDHKGHDLQERRNLPYQNCLESDTELLNQMVLLSNTVVSGSTPNDAVVIAVGVGERFRKVPVDLVRQLDHLGLVADEFLAPRLEWRIMAERFENFDNDEDSQKKPGKLLYDPTVHLSASQLVPSFADPFLAAHGALESKGTTTVDLVLLHVSDPRLLDLAAGLRQLQFPGMQDNYSQEACAANRALNQGRIMVKYGGVRDFLGALTSTNMKWFANALQHGIPYAEVTPVGWAQTYHFDTCSADTVAAIDAEFGIVNGIECGFLPIWGGSCLRNRVNPSLQCMSQFGMGSNTHIVLPANGIPPTVCKLAAEQAGPPKGGGKNSGPTQGFVDWFPQAYVPYKDLDKMNFTVTPQLVADPDKPMNFDQLSKMRSNVADYVGGDDTTSSPLSKRNSMPFNMSVRIEQDVLGSHNGSAQKLKKREFHKSALSSYLVRFNRSSRRRVARARQPREEAMFARTGGQGGWETALATGRCATLHIRRGDNIDRCKKNPGSKFCSMDLSLADYMTKAEPMLLQLDGARHVFVMTDDAAVANETMQAPWRAKGYVFEVISGHNQYSTKTYDEWDAFIESLYGAQFCKAFVGHYVSTVAKLVFNSICHRYGECPMADDFKGKAPKVSW